MEVAEENSLASKGSPVQARVMKMSKENQADIGAQKIREGRAGLLLSIHALFLIHSCPEPSATYGKSRWLTFQLNGSAGC